MEVTARLRGILSGIPGSREVKKSVWVQRAPAGLRWFPYPDIKHTSIKSAICLQIKFL